MMEELKDSLKRYMLDNVTKIYRVSGPELPSSCCFTNLTELSDEIFNSNNVVPLPSQPVHIQPGASLENLFRLPESVELKYLGIEDVFDHLLTIKDKGRVALLVEGAAGVGKTTLTLNLTNCFYSNEKYFDQFDLCVRISLKRLKSYFINLGKETAVDNNAIFESYLSLELLPMNSDQSQVKLLRERILDANSCDLLILDGLDDVGNDLELHSYKKPTPFSALVAKLAKHLCLICTSRPYGVRISTLLNLDLDHNESGTQTKSVHEFTSYTQLVGFSLQNVEQYIESVHPLKSREIWKYIKENRFLEEMVRIPIYLDLLCSCWDSVMKILQTQQAATTAQQPDAEGSIPTLTLTTLFEAIIHSFIIEYSCSKDPTETKNLNMIQKQELTPQQIELRFAKLLNELELQAYDGHEKGRTEFVLNSSNPDLLQAVKFTHFVLPSYAGLRSTSVTYQFTHSVIQDHFIARHISKQVHRDEMCEYIANNKYNVYMQCVWWFVAGILNSGTMATTISSNLRRFYDLFEQDPRDLFGVYHHQTLIPGCMSESGVKNLDEKRVSRFCCNLLEWYSHPLNNLQMQVTKPRFELPDDVTLKLAKKLVNPTEKEASACKARATKTMLCRMRRLGPNTVRELIELLQIRVGDGRRQLQEHWGHAMEILIRQATTPTTELLTLLRETKDENVKERVLEVLASSSNQHLGQGVEEEVLPLAITTITSKEGVHNTRSNAGAILKRQSGLKPESIAKLSKQILRLEKTKRKSDNAMALATCAADLVVTSVQLHDQQVAPELVDRVLDLLGSSEMKWENYMPLKAIVWKVLTPIDNPDVQVALIRELLWNGDRDKPPNARTEPRVCFDPTRIITAKELARRRTLSSQAEQELRDLLRSWSPWRKVGLRAFVVAFGDAHPPEDRDLDFVKYFMPNASIADKLYTECKSTAAEGVLRILLEGKQHIFNSNQYRPSTALDTGLHELQPPPPTLKDEEVFRNYLARQGNISSMRASAHPFLEVIKIIESAFIKFRIFLFCKANASVAGNVLASHSAHIGREAVGRLLEISSPKSHDAGGPRALIALSGIQNDQIHQHMINIVFDEGSSKELRLAAAEILSVQPKLSQQSISMIQAQILYDNKKRTGTECFLAACLCAKWPPKDQLDKFLRKEEVELNNRLMAQLSQTKYKGTFVQQVFRLLLGEDVELDYFNATLTVVDDLVSVLIRDGGAQQDLQRLGIAAKKLSVQKLQPPTTTALCQLLLNKNKTFVQRAAASVALSGKSRIPDEYLQQIFEAHTTGEEVQLPLSVIEHGRHLSSLNFHKLIDLLYEYCDWELKNKKKKPRTDRRRCPVESNTNSNSFENMDLSLRFIYANSTDSCRMATILLPKYTLSLSDLETFTTLLNPQTFNFNRINLTVDEITDKKIIEVLQAQDFESLVKVAKKSGDRTFVDNLYRKVLAPMSFAHNQVPVLNDNNNEFALAIKSGQECIELPWEYHDDEISRSFVFKSHAQVKELIRNTKYEYERSTDQGNVIVRKNYLRKIVKIEILPARLRQVKLHEVVRNALTTGNESRSSRIVHLDLRGNLLQTEHMLQLCAALEPKSDPCIWIKSLLLSDNLFTLQDLKILLRSLQGTPPVVRFLALDNNLISAPPDSLQALFRGFTDSRQVLIQPPLFSRKRRLEFEWVDISMNHFQLHTKMPPLGSRGVAPDPRQCGGDPNSYSSHLKIHTDYLHFHSENNLPNGVWTSALMPEWELGPDEGTVSLLISNNGIVSGVCGHVCILIERLLGGIGQKQCLKIDLTFDESNAVNIRTLQVEPEEVKGRKNGSWCRAAKRSTEQIERLLEATSGAADTSGFFQYSRTNIFRQPGVYNCCTWATRQLKPIGIEFPTPLRLYLLAFVSNTWPIKYLERFTDTNFDMWKRTPTEANRVIFRVWKSTVNPRAPRNNATEFEAGHISVEFAVGALRYYVSLWPDDAVSDKAIRAPVKHVLHALAKDLKVEGKNPDYTICLYSLSVEEMAAAFADSLVELEAPRGGWHILGSAAYPCAASCASIVWKLACAGRIELLISPNEINSALGIEAVAALGDGVEASKASRANDSAGASVYSTEHVGFHVSPSPDALVTVLFQAKRNEIKRYRTTKLLIGDALESKIPEVRGIRWSAAVGVAVMAVVIWFFIALVLKQVFGVEPGDISDLVRLVFNNNETNLFNP